MPPTASMTAATRPTSQHAPPTTSARESTIEAAPDHRRHLARGDDAVRPRPDADLLERRRRTSLRLACPLLVPEIHAAALRHRDGQAIGYASQMIDVTDREHSRTEIVRLAAAMQEAVSHMGDLRRYLAERLPEDTADLLGDAAA
jgi:hypothetical protein